MKTPMRPHILLAVRRLNAWLYVERCRFGSHWLPDHMEHLEGFEP